MRPLWGKFVLGLLAGVIYGVASGAGLPGMTKTVLPIIFQDEEGMKEVPGWFRDGIEGMFGDDAGRLLVVCCFVIPIIFLVRSIGGYFSRYFISEIGLRTIEEFRKEIFDRLLRLPMGFYGKQSSGDLLSRMIVDTSVVQSGVTRAAGDLVMQPVLMVSAVSFLIWQAMSSEGAFFALIGGLTIPLLVLPIRALGKRLKKRSALVQETAGELSGLASEVIANPLEIRAYSQQSRMGGLFGGLVGNWRRLELKMVRYRALLSPTVEVVAAVGFAFSLYLGVQKGLTMEEFVGLAMALFMAYEPVKRLGTLYGVLEQSKAAMERTQLILGAVDGLPEPERAILPAETRGEGEFAGVGFGYGEELVLKDVSVQVRAGETVALVGESGGGKTTFANLIPRFYEVSSGSVKLDGVDVKDYAKAELRRRVALVPQMPVLFRGTIEENILMGKPGASREEVEQAAKQAFAHDFILKQEKGYETDVSEKGSSLSGGQRQRIAIARAFLKDAPVLIMDEATSALDAQSEGKVQEAIRELAKERTTILITHRESTKEFADRVLRFEKGVVDEG